MEAIIMFHFLDFKSVCLHKWQLELKDSCLCSTTVKRHQGKTHNWADLQFQRFPPFSPCREHGGMQVDMVLGSS